MSKKSQNIKKKKKKQQQHENGGLFDADKFRFCHEIGIETPIS